MLLPILHCIGTVNFFTAIAYTNVPYRAAFTEMANDKSISEAMDIVVLKASLEETIAKLGKVEDELLKLKSLKTTSGGFFGLRASPTAVRQSALERHMVELTVKIGIRPSLFLTYLFSFIFFFVYLFM